MTEPKSIFDNIVRWLDAGYPEGVPPKDYFPLLALLKRSLSEDDVIKAAQTVLKSTEADAVTEDEIRKAIHQTTAQEPTPEEIHQVASRLASVGWPLAAPAS